MNVWYIEISVVACSGSHTHPVDPVFFFFFPCYQLICLSLFGTEQLMRFECTYGPYCAHGSPGTDLFRCDASDL